MQKHAPGKQRFTAKQKADMDMFLSMRELSEVTGFGENKLNELKRKSGFPLFEGKTTLSKFREWAFANSTSAAETVPGSRTASNRPHSIAGKSYELFR
jgi:hypothetical protein